MSRRSSRPLPAIASCTESSSRASADQHVESLAGHEPAEPEHERPLGIDAVLRAHCGALGRVDRPEPLRIDTGRDHDVRDRSPGRADARRRRVLPRRDHTGRAAQHPPSERVRYRQPAGQRDLGAVRDHEVRSVAQARSDEPEREHRIDEHDVGADLTRERAGALRHRARRQQHARLHPFDAEVERGVERGRAGMRRGEHGRLPRRQSLPQLREVRLDAADLGREVVGDEQRGQRAAYAGVGSGATAIDRLRDAPVLSATQPTAARTAPTANAAR